MSDASGEKSVSIEKLARVVVGRVAVKTLDDGDLKVLAGLIDQASDDDPTINTVVLDLTRVGMMPSLALGLLLQVARKCRARGQQMKLAGLQPQVRQVFSITKLDRVFHFSDTVEAATAGAPGSEPGPATQGSH